MAKQYTLTEKGTENAKMKGQQALIVRYLFDKPGSTVDEIAAGIAKDLVTRQDPARVVSFYMATWKKKGLVTVSGETVGISASDVGTVSASDIAPDPEEIAAEAPVPTENVGENAPAADTGNVPRKTLGEFISEFATQKGENGFWPDDVVAEANGTVTKKQVQDSIRRLVSRGEIVKADSGEYYAASVMSGAAPATE